MLRIIFSNPRLISVSSPSLISFIPGGVDWLCCLSLYSQAEQRRGPGRPAVQKQQTSPSADQQECNLEMYNKLLSYAMSYNEPDAF